VTLKLPLTVRRVAAHPHVVSNAGRVALARGPLVYCLEGADLEGADPRDVVLDSEAALRAERAPELLGGVVRLRGAGVLNPPAGWDGALYRPADGGEPTGAKGEAVALSAVPYYAWANRAPGPMEVWLRTAGGGG
jgi:DUF1680 family protein